MEHIVPQLLQPPGSHSDVLLEREPGELRDKANDNSGLHEEDIL